MDMTSLTVKLLFLFTPGIICFLIVDALVVHRTRKVHELFLLSYVFGLICYGTYALMALPFSIARTAAGVITISPPNVSMFHALTREDIPADILEVTLVSGLSVILGIVISYARNRYWLHDIARHFHVTPRFGQPNVWSFALNANEVRWATVRDIDKGLMFQGYIRAFSDVEEPAELLLTQVRVYNERTAEFLYAADHLYLARDRSNLTVEFPVVAD